MLTCIPSLTCCASLSSRGSPVGARFVASYCRTTITNPTLYRRASQMSATTNEKTTAEDKAGRTALDESSKDGAFVRKDSTFRHKVSEDSDRFKPEGMASNNVSSWDGRKRDSLPLVQALICKFAFKEHETLEMKSISYSGRTQAFLPKIPSATLLR